MAAPVFGTPNLCWHARLLWLAVWGCMHQHLPWFHTRLHYFSLRLCRALGWLCIGLVIYGTHLSHCYGAADATVAEFVNNLHDAISWEFESIMTQTCSVHEHPVCSDTNLPDVNLWEPGGMLSQSCSAHEQPVCRDSDLTGAGLKNTGEHPQQAVEMTAQTIQPLVYPLALYAVNMVRLALFPDAAG